MIRHGEGYPPDYAPPSEGDDDYVYEQFPARDAFVAGVGAALFCGLCYGAYLFAWWVTS